MKSKAMIILTAIVVSGLVAAAAWGGPGGRGGYGYGANTGPQSQAFLDETADLRNELAGKRGEYNALMSRENPDPKEAARIQQEMQKIREQIRVRAQSYQDSSADGRGNYSGRWGHHRGGGGYCW